MVDLSILFTSVRGCLVRHAHGYRQFPRLLGLPLLSPFRFRPVARLQLQSTHLAGTLLPLRFTLRFLHGRAPRVRSVVILHCLGGGCQCLRFLSNVSNAATVICGPRTPIVLLLLSVTLGFRSGYKNCLFLSLVSTKGVFLLIPPHVFI